MTIRRERGITDLISLDPIGQVTDFGDVIRQERWLLKGRRLRFILNIGAPQKVTPEDRIPSGIPAKPADLRKVHVMATLHADKKATFSIGEVLDEEGNVTTFDGTYSYAADNPSLVNVTDNGDGTAVVAAVGGAGNVGVALLTVTGTPTSGGATIEHVEAINVVAGDAATFNVTMGPEEEVTPDV